MSQHLTLTVQDDGQLLATDDAALRQWAQALQEAAPPRICIATHGGLVSWAVGNRFASYVQQIKGLGWSVTFLTQTDLFSTLRQTIDDVMNTNVLDWFDRLVQRLRQGNSAVVLPHLVAHGNHASGPHILIRTVDPIGHLSSTVTLQRVGPPQPITDPIALTARDQVVALLQKALPNKQSDLPRLVEQAARAAARRLPPSPTQVEARVQLVGQGQRHPRQAHWTGPTMTLGMPEHRPSRQRSIRSAAPLRPGDLDVQAILIETLARELFEIPGLWRTMKRRMDLMYAAGGAGDRVLQTVRDFPAIEVNLLGHSLGGIAVDYALRRAVLLGITQQLRHAVYLAPANTWEFHRETRRRLGQDVPQFHVLQLTDEKERDQQQATAPGSWIYPRSLLYLISEALEGASSTPILGMQKFRPARSNPRDVLALTPEENGLRHATHGGFVEDSCVRAWIAKQWK